MSAFDKVIGYTEIKNELLQICDMIKNKDVYEKLGARLPNGVLLYGKPGLGKTLMANCFIEESGLKSYVIRRNVGESKFIDQMRATFNKAKANAPSMVMLDDMDKYANEDYFRCDAQEYVAVQAFIDEVKHCGVFVIGTINDIEKLPKSLVRPGRFDRKINVHLPTAEEAKKIIRAYLGAKNVSGSVNWDDITKMMSYNSCSELEVMANEAAIRAAFDRRDSIDMEDIISAVLRLQYDSVDNLEQKNSEEIRKTALHEAGHLVVSEVLNPGSIGLASIRTSGQDNKGGFVHFCKEPRCREHNVMIALAGKAAVEMYIAESCATGCESDIYRAYSDIKRGITKDAEKGFAYITQTCGRHMSEESDALRHDVEKMVGFEVDRYMKESRKILTNNRGFLEKVADELMKHETLVYSQIQDIRKSYDIVK